VAAGRIHRVALTGGVATGKTTVRRAFERLGIPTIDADLLARDAVARGSDGLQRVVERFGADVLDAAGELDRRKLGALVFDDESARRDLEAIVHPYVRERMEQWFGSLDPARHPLAIADIPLLYEVGRDRDFEAVIVAATDPATQLRRVMERDRLSEPDARRRVAAQLPIEEKVRRADYVIRTDGTFAATDEQVKAVLRQLEAH
jgi:dephospho-CoA kinase